MAQTLLQRVSDRYLVRLAVQEVCAERDFRQRRASVQDFNPEVLEAFAEGFYLLGHQGRVAFGNLVQKLKALAGIFTKIPQLWEKFKDLLGIQGVSDLPRAIKDLAKRGYAALRRGVESMFSKWPLKLYTLERGKLRGVDDLIENLIKMSPKLDHWLRTKVKPRADQMDMWLRQHAPALSTILVLGVYVWIWWNVTEFEWDLRSLADDLLNIIGGNITLADLFSSLPSSVLGFLLNALNFGTFTFLPIALAVRILFLLAERYLIWTGRGFALNREQLSEDFGIAEEQLKAVEARL